MKKRGGSKLSKLKSFLKPDWRKILLAVISFVLTFFYVYRCSSLKVSGVCEARGLPLYFYICKTMSDSPSLDCSFLYFWLIADIIFWYLLSSLLISAYDKYRGKNT